MKLSSKTVARLIASALYVAVMAGTWDAWWHGALGRESFWSPPHFFLYASVIVAVSLGFYGWNKFREPVWKHLALVLLLVPLSAPFDDLWHRTFGIETVASPLIVWSPPHLLLIGAIVWSLTQLLPLLHRDSDRDAQRLFGAMVFAAIINLMTFVAAPLLPIGPYHLLGFWGAGFGCLAFIGPMLVVRRWVAGIGAAFLTSMLAIGITAISFGERLSSRVIVPAHEHFPAWLVIFSFLIPAVFLDVTPRLANWLRGAVAGVLCCGTLYIFATHFFEPRFQYGFSDTLAAVISGVLVGFIVGFMCDLIFRKKPVTL